MRAGLVEKVKETIEQGIGLPFRYGTGEELDAYMGNTPMPAVMMYRLEGSTSQVWNTQRVESATCTLFFVERTSYENDSEENDRIIQRCKQHADEWINFVQHGVESPLWCDDSEIEYERIYLQFEDVFTGIGVRLRLTEVQGECFYDPYYARLYGLEPPRLYIPKKKTRRWKTPRNT